jgi:hypothetical protein
LRFFRSSFATSNAVVFLPQLDGLVFEPFSCACQPKLGGPVSFFRDDWLSDGKAHLTHSLDPSPRPATAGKAVPTNRAREAFLEQGGERRGAAAESKRSNRRRGRGRHCGAVFQYEFRLSSMIFGMAGLSDMRERLTR